MRPNRKRDRYGVPQGRYGVPQGQYGVPQGRYGVPQGRYGVPQGRLAEHCVIQTSRWSGSVFQTSVQGLQPSKKNCRLSGKPW